MEQLPRDAENTEEKTTENYRKGAKNAKTKN